MYKPQSIAALCTACALVGISISRIGHAEPADEDLEPAVAMLRLGARAGGGYDSNVLLNANDKDDKLGIAGVTVDGDLLPSDAVVLKGSYRADLEVYRTQSSQSNVAQLVDLLFGYRPQDLVYLSISGGAEHAYFRNDREYTFFGAFGRAAARLEVGDATTLLGSYEFRNDHFPGNNLDNVAHTAMVAWEMAVADSVDIYFPITYENTRYTERYVLHEDTLLPSDLARTANRWRAEPGITLFPTYSLRLAAVLRAELNDSNDTYTTRAAPPGTQSDGSFIRHYDSYRAGSIDVDVRWEPAFPFILTLWTAGGRRTFPQRPAFVQENGPTGEKQVDTWFAVATSLIWRLGSHLEVTARYTYTKQSSNNVLWDYDHHRTLLVVSGWWLGES